MKNRESLLEPYPAMCTIGNRIDCKHLNHDAEDDVDFFCEHPDLEDDEENCPLSDEELEQDEDDIGNQDEEE